jgi:pimeloyl-ACP methyl ester carboxylesterase
METRKTRSLGPARIVALVLVALAVSALAYLRFAPDADPVSVPSGAHAGELILKPCTYGTERGRYPADCGTLVVPENRDNPSSRLIALPVTRIRARSAHPGTPIFRLEGGPGITNMDFSKASRFAGTHDVVLVGYRGVDGSSRLDCPEVVSVLKHSADMVGTKAFRAKAGAYRACANRLRADGFDLAGYTLPQRVDDLEAARRALGYRRIDLISESAGTRTAMIYSWRHPKSIRRSVMIAVNPPGHFLWNPQTTDAEIQRYSKLCAADAGCRGRTDDLAASMRRTSAHMPDHWLFLPIKRGNVRLASFFGLMDSSSAAAPISSPMTLDSWLSAANGDASGLWFMSLMADIAFPQAQVWGDVGAASRADAAAAKRFFATQAHRTSILHDAGTEFIWAGGRLVDGWPSNPSDDQYSRVQDSNVETLLIGGTLDFATPPVNATRELLPHLPNGHQVVLPNFGHTNDFWTYQPGASSHLVNTFLDTGKVDESRYSHRAMDFTPDVRQTALAKGTAGALVGLPLLAVISLLLMWRRVRSRGSFGRKAGAFMRSLYPIVLGLGGWFAGAVVVLTAMPTVPLDNDLLAGLSIGLPIGLGMYWAWVHRDWSVTTKTVGFSAAVSGALVGAWLGFNAASGMLALVTTIVGAAAGGNLTLLALDIAWDRSAHDRVAETVASPQPAFSSAEVQSQAR